MFYSCASWATTILADFDLQDILTVVPETEKQTSEGRNG